jgi:hypothetical protein
MNVDTKILLVRLAAGVGLALAIWLAWWMDYRWKRSPLYVPPSKRK